MKPNIKLKNRIKINKKKYFIYIPVNKKYINSQNEKLSLEKHLNEERISEPN
jgi:hypothetical protein